jgi:hypothetical protein
MSVDTHVPAAVLIKYLVVGIVLFNSDQECSDNFLVHASEHRSYQLLPPDFLHC